MRLRYIRLIVVTLFCSYLPFYVFYYRSTLFNLLSPKYEDLYPLILQTVLGFITLISFLIVFGVSSKYQLLIDWQTTFKAKRLVELVLITFLLISINIVINRWLSSYLVENSNTNQAQIIHLYHIYPKVLFFISSSLGAGCFEEIIYRAGLFKLINHPQLAYVLSIIIFAFVHSQDLSLIAYLPTGIILGYLYYKHQRISDCIFVHSLHNLLSYFI